MAHDFNVLKVGQLNQGLLETLLTRNYASVGTDLSSNSTRQVD